MSKYQNLVIVNHHVIHLILLLSKEDQTTTSVQTCICSSNSLTIINIQNDYNFSFERYAAEIRTLMTAGVDINLLPAVMF